MQAEQLSGGGRAEDAHNRELVRRGCGRVQQGRCMGLLRRRVPRQQLHVVVERTLISAALKPASFSTARRRWYTRRLGRGRGCGGAAGTGTRGAGGGRMGREGPEEATLRRIPEMIAASGARAAADRHMMTIHAFARARTLLAAQPSRLLAPPSARPSSAAARRAWGARRHAIRGWRQSQDLAGGPCCRERRARGRCRRARRTSTRCEGRKKHQNRLLAAVAPASRAVPWLCSPRLRWTDVGSPLNRALLLHPHPLHPTPLPRPASPPASLWRVPAGASRSRTPLPPHSANSPPARVSRYMVPPSAAGAPILRLPLASAAV